MAESLSGAHPLRALDAIHVASAKLFADRSASQAFTFVSADSRQTDVADALGIQTRYIEA
jgi:predicted nucleic acid-binding protein